MRKSCSNDYPRIQRLQGVILYPINVTETVVDKVVNYEYDELLIEDTGQQIEDEDRFVKENWALLRTSAYAAREIMTKQTGMWESYTADVRSKFGTDAVVK